MLPQLHFPGAVYNHHAEADSREWLITNGSGSFASGTIAGTLTRRYHGLLIAALRPPGERTLLVSQARETVITGSGRFDLSTDNRPLDKRKPDGTRFIENFYLDGTSPVWEYRLGNILLEKRVWMLRGENTTHVRYRVLEGDETIHLKAEVLVNARDMHAETGETGVDYKIEAIASGLRIVPPGNHDPFYIFSPSGAIHITNQRQREVFLAQEAFRGLPAFDRHLSAGVFAWNLGKQEDGVFVCSTNGGTEFNTGSAFLTAQVYELDLLQKAGPGPAERSRLVLAADQFIVTRPLPGDPNGRTVIAGYHWFSDWGRDTMIALPGLTLATGRPEIARKILTTFAPYVSKGMLPNQFPEAGEAPEYNTVDAALWYFEAVRAYVEKTGDLDLLQRLHPVLEEIIHFYNSGTRYNIHVDPADGLLYAGVQGKQITWMDVKIGDWVVTPRIGKPVEINALWYNALQTMAAFSESIGYPGSNYADMAMRTRAGFQRFWNSQRGYCFDVLDSEVGNDPALRPNQLFAVSLPHSPLSTEKQKAVVDICRQELVTPYGLRSLGVNEPAYAGSYGGDQFARDSVYHQGTVWGWLIGPFVAAHLRVYQDPETARGFLQPLSKQVETHGLGTLSEIFEGNPPHHPRGAVAQAWTVAEWLRAWDLTAAGEKKSPEHMTS